MTKQELATRIWATANTLRKNIKASEYKDYILGFMFYKYLCDKEMDYLTDLGGDLDDLKIADSAIKDKFKDGIGYFITYENLFRVWKMHGGSLGAKDVAMALDDFYLNLNGQYKAVFDNVFSALQSGLNKLGENAGSRDKAIRDIVDLVDLIPPTSRDYDVLGYIYEYLIQQFSSEAKKDGAFYTPHELTSLMSRVVAERLKDRTEVSCYDPTVGSAGLLLNMGKEVGKYVPSDNIHYYGQELITETANLAKMNLFMCGAPVQNINMRNANTLEEDWPYFDSQTSYKPLFVDAVVSNPPYSAHYEPDKHVTDERFKGYGLAPEGKADYAFLLHCLYHIKPDGIMAIVLPHGVLFRGDSEGEIRKNLILNHNIETIISLPANMFFATGIPVIVMILSKNRQADDILFVDASQSFKKDKKQNVLTDSDVQRIFDTIVARQDVPNYAHVASMNEIKANDFNLNVPRYVSAAAQEAPYDLFSVMTGTVSDAELDAFEHIWSRTGLRQKLVQKLPNGYYTFADVDVNQVVFDDPGVQDVLHKFANLNGSFRDYLIKVLLLEPLGPAAHDAIVKALFKWYKTDVPLAYTWQMALVDVYQVFQAFADNWGVVDADYARLYQEGWHICAETEPNMITKKDAKSKKTVEVQDGWKGKIMPFELIKSEFYAAELQEMNQLFAEAEAKKSEAADAWESMDEDAKAVVCKDDDESQYDKKKFKTAVKDGSLDQEAVKAVKTIMKCLDDAKTCADQAKAIGVKLEDAAKTKVENLTDSEVRCLLVKKWVDPIIDSINQVGESVFTQFVADFKALQKKYSNSLSELSSEIESTGAELKASLNELTGADTDMAAIQMLLEEL